jgi:hypothetical protein
VQAIQQGAEVIFAQQLRDRLSVDPMALVVELEAGKVDDAVVALEEGERMLDLGPHLVHRQGMAAIEEHRQDGALELLVVGQLTRCRWQPSWVRVAGRAGIPD